MEEKLSKSSRYVLLSRGIRLFKTRLKKIYLKESSGTRMVVIEDGPKEKVKKLRIYGDQQKVEIAEQLVHDFIAEELKINVRDSFVLVSSLFL